MKSGGHSPGICSASSGLHFWRGMPEEPHPAWLLAECFMKPVVCYAVAAKPFATPGRTAIAELLAIGSGGYFRVGDRMALAKKNSIPAALSHFYARKERMTGQGREAKPRCRPRLEESTNDAPLPEQGELGLPSPGFRASCYGSAARQTRCITFPALQRGP